MLGLLGLAAGLSYRAHFFRMGTPVGSTPVSVLALRGAKALPVGGPFLKWFLALVAPGHDVSIRHTWHHVKAMVAALQIRS